MVVSGQFNCTKDTGSMPFLLSVLLSFQGYSHLFGVGSFSNVIYKKLYTTNHIRHFHAAKKYPQNGHLWVYQYNKSIQCILSYPKSYMVYILLITIIQVILHLLDFFLTGIL